MTQVVKILPQVKQRTYLLCIVNIMGADVLATQGARASATKIFTMLIRIHSAEAETKWMPLRKRHFQVHFFKKKMFEFWIQFDWRLFLRVQLTISDSYNGLAPNRWRTIIWTNDGLGWWRIYASLGFNELRVNWGQMCQCLMLLNPTGETRIFENHQ